MKGEPADDADMLAFEYSTEVAERASRTMRELPRLSKSDATQWVDYWESVGWLGSHNLA